MEQIFINYLNTLTEFISYEILSIYENNNSALVKVIKSYFNENITKYILLKYDNECSFEYVGESDTSKIDKLTNLVNKMLILQLDSLSKNLQYSETYSEEKTNIIFDTWKYIIMNSDINFDNDIKEGLNYYETNDNDLNENQISQKNKVLNWKNKLKARNKIECEIGDIQDLMADVSKRIALIERLVMRMGNKLINGAEWDEDVTTRYTQYLAWYCNLVDSGQFVDRTDLENESELINTLLSRASKISNIVKTEYFDKKL